jgi:hypothetical protein
MRFGQLGKRSLGGWRHVRDESRGVGGGQPVAGTAYDSDLISNMIPYVQSHYDVSTTSSERAFSGLSLGGAITNSLMPDHTSEFGYYGVMSAGLPCPTAGCTSVTLTPAQAAALKQVGIFVGGGWQDPVLHARQFFTSFAALAAAAATLAYPPPLRPVM